MVLVDAKKPVGSDSETDDNSDNGGNGIDLTGEHYNLNIIGKKSSWSGGVDNTDTSRHTMFVPENSSTFSYTGPDGNPVNGSVGIEFTRGDDFAVLDPNAFDDGWCQFQVGRGTYQVYITCKAKPGYTSDIGSWVYAENESGGQFLFNVGEIQVKGRKFVDCTDMFMVSEEEDEMNVSAPGQNWWVFDYLDYLEAYDFGENNNITQSMYFWDLQNNGNKLLKMRFYPV